jgi:hypothetical protein
MVLQVIALPVNWVQLGRQSDSEKDLEILLLRWQLAILERKQTKPLGLSRTEKVTLVVLATKLKAQTGDHCDGRGDQDRQTDDTLRLAQAAGTLEVDLSKSEPGWTTADRTRNRAARGAIARENDWGFERIEGKLLKLGYDISHETVGNILRQHGFHLSQSATHHPIGVI